MRKSIMKCKEKHNCICCDSSDLITILDLNDQPLANSYHDLKEELEKFPLRLNLCNRCYHLQLSHIVNPDLLFRDYLYVSGTTQTLRDYFDWFAEFSVELSTKKIGKVLDIACNDGSQLNSFKKLNWETYGIDPAKNLYEISSKNHSIICDYFTSDLFQNMEFDIITAQNVFAHNENALQFLNDCEIIMNDDSLLFIQTSQSEMIKNNEFDTIYHEHLSFFNINSFNELVKRTNLHLINVIKTPIHGISYIFVLSKKDINNHLIKNLINVEKEYGLLNSKTYDNYRNNVFSIVNKFVDITEEYKSNGYKLVGYGAAAKGMTFLNFANVKLDFIADDNPLKHNLYTPNTNIKILPISEICEMYKDEKILFIPLAWNFFDEIKRRIEEKRNTENDVFLRYFPEIKVIK